MYRVLRLWLLLCGLVTSSFSALAQSWNQVAPLDVRTVNGVASGARTAVDAAGNVYVSGTFRGTITLGNTTLTSTGQTDIFVAKLNSAGQWQWAAAGGSAADDSNTGLALDATGNVYLTGDFSGSSAVFGSSTLTNGGATDPYVAKLSASGQWLWATSAAGPVTDHSSGLALDAAGNVLIAGTFGGAAFGSIALFTSGGVNAFVAKLSPSGQWLWAVQGGGPADDYANGIATDAAGNAYIIGYAHSGSITFGTINTSSNTTGGFVAKLNPSGQWQWVEKVASMTVNDSQFANYGHAIAADAAGNVCIMAPFTSVITLGSTTLTSAGHHDIYVAKLNTGGQWLWATRAGGSDTEQGRSIAIDGTGSVYVTGGFKSRPAAFGSSQLSNTSTQATDGFVAKLDASGQWLWASAVASRAGIVEGVAVDAAGNAYTTGQAEDDITLGTIQLPSTQILQNNSSSYADLFVAKISGGQWQWAVREAGGGDQVLGSSTWDAAGNAYVLGYFKGRIQLGNQVLTSPTTAGYVAKRSTSGQWQWAVPITGLDSRNNTVQTISLDAAGNVLISGVYRASLVLGSTTLATPTGSSRIGSFVAKLSADGQWQWAIGTAGNFSTDHSLDAQGNVYLTGTLQNSSTFGTTTLTPSAAQELYVAKLGANGQWQWAIAGPGASSTAIATDASGNSYLTGNYLRSVAFGPTTLTATSGRDIFMAKLTANGQWLWANTAGGASNEFTHDIVVDAAGSVYLTGQFASAMTFGNTTLSYSGDPPNFFGTPDTFVAKADANGQWQWAVSPTCVGTDYGSRLAVDSRGDVYVLGNLQSAAAMFGSTTLVGTSPSAGNRALDVYVAKLSSGGQWRWALSASSQDRNDPIDLAVDASGTVRASGNFRGQNVAFGTIILPNGPYTTGVLLQIGGNVLKTAQPASDAAPVQAYPNPYTSLLTLQLPWSGPIEVTAHDVLGRVRLRKQVRAQAGQQLALPDAASWPSGVYLLTIRQGDRQQVLKVVRQ
ncbi:hypothetical protein Hsw_1402 [Hymenobacter swuensis DY53]|uniref:Secretion system C-terminal sorting domain-containing protein n=2 Tax=Hymenobacter TaxID=89966 RepID=W8EZ25_9BACT|nr:hypothetical protein Hsw_1402 [Hymenobacter swuensis DY53]